MQRQKNCLPILPTVYRLLPTFMISAIHDRLAREGQITFSEFMRLALYDAREGYYSSAREKFGAGGDFYTASQVHELFGALLADEFASVWQAARA